MTGIIRRQTNALQFFIGLQCLDVFTTLVFLSKGMTEGNPLVNWALTSAHAPWMGLIATKMIAVLAAQFCYSSGRGNLLRKANAAYALVVAWNMVGIAASLFAR